MGLRSLRNNDRQNNVLGASFIGSWDKEYDAAFTIPSTRRAAPSHALRLFADFISLKEVSDTQVGTRPSALDVGCGNGRNSIFLARLGYDVTAIDYSNSACQLSQKLIEEKYLGNKIQVKNVSVFEYGNRENVKFDLIIDSYVSCHYPDISEFKLYWKRLISISKKETIFYTAQFAYDDEYYRELPDKQTRFGKMEYVVDQANYFPKIIFIEKALRSVLEQLFDIDILVNLKFTDKVNNRLYRRSVFAVMFRQKAAGSTR